MGITDSRKYIEEDDPRSIKLANTVLWNASEEDLLFLKQIGLRWVRLNHESELPNVDHLHRVHDRFARCGRLRKKQTSSAVQYSGCFPMDRFQQSHRNSAIRELAHVR